MKRITLFSALLLIGLMLSQALPWLTPRLFHAAELPIKWLTMATLAYIMIGVGLEFEVDRKHPGRYAFDYGVAAVAAALPWLLCASYFILVMSPSESWGSTQAWQQSLLISRFSAPTSAGILFAMLAAAGLGATWTFKKARTLAIFDDLDTILLMIPLKILMVGLHWQLFLIALIIFGLLFLGWRFFHALQWPLSWSWRIVYAIALATFCESLYSVSLHLRDAVPIQLEVLLPAFVLGMVLPSKKEKTAPDEDRVDLWVSSFFMLFVGLSMPRLMNTAPADGFFTLTAIGGGWPGWSWIVVHVLAVTALSNIGKLFPWFCYRNEASFRERLALAVCLFPRGEVGAGVLVISIAYGIGGPVLTVALLSLALNLALTGGFVICVRKLIPPTPSVLVP